MPPAFPKGTQTSSTQGQPQVWGKWQSNTSLRRNEELQLIKPWPFFSMFGEVTMNTSLGFVFVMMEGSRTQRPLKILQCKVTQVTLALALESRRLRFESPFCHLLALPPWTSLFTFLKLSLLLFFNSTMATVSPRQPIRPSMRQIKHLTQCLEV